MCGLPVAAEDAPPAASRFAAPRRELSLEAHVERINGALAAAKLGNPRASLAFHTRAERRMKWGAEGTFFSGLLDFCAAAKLGLKEWHGAYDLAPGGHRLVELAAEGATLSGIHPAGVLDGTRRVTFVFCHELTGDSLDLELEALFAGQAIEAERIGTGVASGEWELSIPAGAKGDLTVIVRAAGETERVLLKSDGTVDSGVSTWRSRARAFKPAAPGYVVSTRRHKCSASVGIGRSGQRPKPQVTIRRSTG